METVEETVVKEDLDKVIKHHVWASIGIGLVPVPAVDMVALTAIQLNLVRKIAKSYEVPFSRDRVKNIIASLLGSALPSSVGPTLAASITKSIPVIGWTAGAVTMPAIAGASTYAVAKVFVQHFGTGGTFLTFDPDRAKEYYAEMFKEGKKVAGEGEKLAEDVEVIKKTPAAKKKKGKTKADTGS
ncbi:MAG: DUF697 domain-containing protein [Desulfobacterales bacterium]|nr:DUF697 domain-containing protein [Desulfobacterales bacterium]